MSKIRQAFFGFFEGTLEPFDFFVQGTDGRLQLWHARPHSNPNKTNNGKPDLLPKFSIWSWDYFNGKYWGEPFTISLYSPDHPDSLSQRPPDEGRPK